MLHLDQIARKTPEDAANSWCKEPLQDNQNHAKATEEEHVHPEHIAYVSTASKQLFLEKISFADQQTANSSKTAYVI